MYPGSLPFALPLLAVAALTAGIASYAFRRPKQPGAITFGWLMTAMTLWSAFNALEFIATTLSEKIISAKLEYIGIASIPPLWLAFALEYTGHADWLTRNRRGALITFFVLTFGLALTNEFHHLIWKGTSLDPAGFSALMITGHGVWFWIYTVISYILIFAGIVLYLTAFARAHHLFRQQISVIVAGSLIPLIGNTITLIFPLHGFDLTPFTFAFSGIFLAIGLFRYGLIELIPVAAALVIENLRDAVVVMDEHKRLVDLNPAAKLWLRVGDEAIGRDAREILPLLKPIWQYWDANETHIQLDFGEGDQRQLFDISITPLRDSKKSLTGRVIIARDVSREQILLAAERNHASQMELLNVITNTALQMPDLHQALQVLADQLSLLLRADGAFITLWNDEEQRVIPATAYGEYRETYKDMKLEPGENTMTASVLREGRPLAVEDVYDTPYMNPQLALDVPTRSLLGLPLIANERKMGAALISFNQRHQFTTEEISLGEQAAGQIALAVYKAQLYETERNHARQMERLNSITRASLEITNFREMLQTLADEMGELLQSDGATITLWDELKQKTIPVAATGDLRETYPTMNFESSETTLTKSVLRAGHALEVEDSFNTPYMSASISARFPGRSLLALPLIAHEQKLGAALIIFHQPHRFTRQEVAIGEQAAAQIALALNKAQLLDTVSHRIVQLGLLQEVSRQMTESLDVTEVCQRTVDAMINVFGYDEAAISLLVEKNELELIAIGGTKDMGFSPGFRQYVGQGIMGHVAETHNPYFSNDIIHDPYYYHPSSKGAGSAMGVPMLREGQLMGVVYVQSTPPHAIIPDDIQTLQTLASHLVTAIQKARLYANAHEHLTSMTTLQSVTETVTSSLDLENIFSTVVQLLKETYGYTYVSIYLLNDSTLQLGAQAGYPQDLIIHEIPVNTGITGRTVRTRQTQFIPNVRIDPTFLIASYDVESEICVPLLKNDNILGVLNIESASNRPLTKKDVDLLISIANPVALAIDNAHLHARATSLALTDGMTGLFNRRAFDQVLETELARAKRYGHPLSLIILDMDSFKMYNDTYGHPAGDERLKAIANIMLENVRDPDVAARYGGEEFAIILPHTTKEGAIFLAERLREISEGQAPGERIDHTYIPGYTISLGVATFPYDGITVPAILRAADNAEMNAKRLGKNRVCSAESSENFFSEQA